MQRPVRDRCFIDAGTHIDAVFYGKQEQPDSRRSRGSDEQRRGAMIKRKTKQRNPYFRWNRIVAFEAATSSSGRHTDQADLSETGRRLGHDPYRSDTAWRHERSSRVSSKAGPPPRRAGCSGPRRIVSSISDFSRESTPIVATASRRMRDSRLHPGDRHTRLARHEADADPCGIATDRLVDRPARQRRG